ncbi:hypothetical protein B7463_g10331, partial [Scytalidium lignicola]
MADIRLTLEAEEFLKSTKDAIFQRCDVTKWSDLQHLITVSKDKFRDVPDVYVARAGVFEPSWSNFWDDTEDARYAGVDINVNHPIKLTRIAMRALLSKNKKGVVLITASMAGNVRTPLWTAQQKEQFHFTDEISILPEDVANSMMSLIQDGKYGGEASLEVSAGLTRTLGTWNISESNIAGHSDMNYAPILELMRKERNAVARLST